MPGRAVDRDDGVTAPKPKITLPEVLPLVRDYYARDGNSSGGNLHVILDDGNIERHNIGWCFNRARENGDTAGMRLAWKLMRLTISQRKRLVRSRY